MAEPARTRRSSAEIRELVLHAANEAFLAQGYDNTTTVDIARRAGVTEKQVFRAFGSKAALFEATMLGRFEEFSKRYRSIWLDQVPDSTPEDRVALMVRELFELAESNRAILLSAVARDGDADDPQKRLLRKWAETLQAWEDLAEDVRIADDLDIDPPASIAAAGALAFGLVLLEDLLFVPGAESPDRERRIHAMTRMATHGLLARRPD